MPINIPGTLPARETLQQENIFVMTDERAAQQDIRPLRIAIVNLMPTKIATETQLLRLLSNTPLQIEIELVCPATHSSKNTPAEHLLAFYKTFDDIRDQRFDGMIVTGAPVEMLDFSEVDYWDELCRIMDWSLTNVYSVMHICWGAQAGLYHHYGVPKYPLAEKTFGVFRHRVLEPEHPLVRGFDENFLAPHSRHTEVRAGDILAHPELSLLVTSEDAGVYLAAGRGGRHVFVTGHSEYDSDTLASEYFRDVKKGLPIRVPANYFPDDNPDLPPLNTWRSHAHLLFSNWLNYFVYQTTPYDLAKL